MAEVDKVHVIQYGGLYGGVTSVWENTIAILKSASLYSCFPAILVQLGHYDP